MKYNQDFSGIAVTDEIINRASSTAAALVHDTILDDSSIEIWTGAGGTGTQLTEGTDFELDDLDATLTAEAGSDIYLTLAIINGTYHSTNLYVSYKTVGDFNDAGDVNILSYAGMVQMYAGATAPSGWLICDGAAINRITYSALFDAIGTAWGVGDGSTTFNIPDLRGAAPAGVGTSTGYTEDETIALGTKYNDQAQEHIHPLAVDGASGATAASDGAGYLKANNVALGRINSATTPITLLGTSSNLRPIGLMATDGTNGTPRTGNTTRGKVVGINFIIKATA
jgi:microcystin-dependent protein